MDKAFPLLFFPAFRLQDSLQKHFLGERERAGCKLGSFDVCPRGTKRISPVGRPNRWRFAVDGGV